MKRILLIIAIMAAALQGSAQTEAGQFLIGGNLEFNSTKGDDGRSKTTSFLIVPGAGYFISNNLAIGAGIGYQTGRYRQNQAFDDYYIYTDIKSHGFIFNPYIRTYKNISGQFKLYAQLSGSYNHSTSSNYLTTAGSNGKITSNLYGAQISPGLVFFPSQRFGIEFAISGISYYYSKIEYPDNLGSYATKAFGINANFLSPRVGVQYYFK